MAKSTKTIKRDLPPLDLRATVKPDTYNKEKRTVDVIFSTGAKVLRGYWDKYYEELSLDPKHVRMERINNSAPFLSVHNAYDLFSVLGVIEPGSVRLTGGQMVGTVRFSQRDDVEPILRDIADGILANISIGYRVYKYEQVEGGEETIPTYRCVDWEPYEGSVVPMGADDGAGFRALPGGQMVRSAPQERNSVTIIARSEGERKMDPEETAVVTREPAAPAATKPDAKALAAATEEGRKAERVRIDTITTIVRTAKLDDKFAKPLIDEGKTVDQAREAVLDALATRDAKDPIESRHSAAVVTADARDKFMRGASIAVLQRSGGMAMLGRSKNEELLALAKESAGEFRGLSLLDLARHCLEHSGVNTRGMDRMTLVGRSFTTRNSAHGTSDFPALLENIMHKVLRAAYELQEDTWSRVCYIGTVTDFRRHNQYQMGMFGALDSKTENGEFKRKSIPDGAKETVGIETVGNIIDISRETIINDDMNAFTRLPSMLGRAAKLTIEGAFYTELGANAGLGTALADTSTVFHDANHHNIDTTAAAPSVTSLPRAADLMGSQKDINNKEYLIIKPAIFLGNLAVARLASVVTGSLFDPDTANKLQRKNPTLNMFRDIVGTPRLSASTRWYVFAEPDQAPVFQVSFLDGQREPMLESKDGWTTDGTELRARLDFGVDPVDFRGGATNAGA
jgi:hypothetical protein